MFVSSFFSNSKPVSQYNMSKETSLVAQVAIRAASICIFSSALILYCVQLSNITSAYSKTGLIKEVLIISSDCLSKMNFKFMHNT